MTKREKDKKLRDEQFLKSIFASLTDDEKKTFCDFLHVGLFGIDESKDYEKTQETFRKMGKDKQEVLAIIIGDATFIGAKALNLVEDAITAYILSYYSDTNYEDYTNILSKKFEG